LTRFFIFYLTLFDIYTLFYFVYICTVCAYTILDNMIDKSTNPKDFPGYLIWQASKDWHRQLDALLSTFNLTYIQFLVLINLNFLLDQNKYVSQKDIVLMMDEDKNIVSQVIKRLEAKKLVRRRVDKNDTRSKLVFLTESGQNKVNLTSNLIDLKDRVYLEARLRDIDGFMDNLKLFIE
jgi:DNA-binding MarR family transcriptional regulator